MDRDSDPRRAPGGLSRRGFFGVAGLALLERTGTSDRQVVAQCHISTPTATPSPGNSEFEELSILELQAGMASGRWTSRAIVQGCLGRIEALDRRGPDLRHVLETNPDALEIADTLDRERREGRSRGPLHGIPVLLKDNIDTADRMTTTAGSLALEGSHAPRDAFLAERLREAGAVRKSVV